MSQNLNEERQEGQNQNNNGQQPIPLIPPNNQNNNYNPNQNFIPPQINNNNQQPINIGQPPIFNHQNNNMNYQQPGIFRNDTITYNEFSSSYTDQSGIYSSLENNNQNLNNGRFPQPPPINNN